MAQEAQSLESRLHAASRLPCSNEEYAAACCRSMLPHADESARGAHRLPWSGEEWRPRGVPPAAEPDPCGPVPKLPNLRVRAPGIPAAIERASSAAVSTPHTSAYVAYVSV
jgi:hypothetical protein